MNIKRHVPHYLEWTLFEVYLEEGIAALCGTFGKAEKPLYQLTSLWFCFMAKDLHGTLNIYFIWYRIDCS